MPKQIIGVAGEMASGKDTVIKYLVESYGATQFHFSEPLRQILGIMSLEITRDNMITLSYQLRQGFGEDILAHIIGEGAKNSTSHLVAIDGVRRVSDIETLKDDGNFCLIYTEADMKTRYERLQGRHQNADDATTTFEEFQDAHNRETERTIPALKSLARFVITNEGSKEELRDQVDAVMQELGIEKK